MIVKIQRPLESNDSQSVALVYNQSRSYSAYLPMSEIAHLFANGEPKVYHKAKLSNTEGIKSVTKSKFEVLVSLQNGDVAQNMGQSNDRLVIGKRMPDQSW